MHYNQDYLLHSIRTDFIGRNGIGKSLIADLIQLIFITDRSLVVFGTDSVKKKDRQIHTLPYKTSDAYAFMNIEVANGQFVTIGVNIPNNRSRPIRSFWILSQTYNERDDFEIKEMCFEKSSVVMHQDFVADRKILSIDKLAIHLRDTKRLYLRYFTDSRQKQEFYSFLYHKEILPINLTIEENRKTFSKIIQSFSKAKSLNTDSDKSLKEFIFEGDDDVLKENFESNQQELDKLIRDTRELDQYIQELITKQRNLLKLRNLDEIRKSSHHIFLSTKVVLLCRKLEEINQELHENEYKFKSDQSELLLEEKTLPELTKLIEDADVAFKDTEEICAVLKDYKTIYLKKTEVQERIDEFEKIEIPNVSSESKIEVDMASFDFKEVKRRVVGFTSIYKQYGSLTAMVEKTHSQKTMVLNFRNELNQTASDLRRVQSLISLNRSGTLFAKIFQEKKVLSEKQETVLLAMLSDAHLGKPSKAEPQTRYTLDLSALDEKWIKEDETNNGYWFKMGGVHEFVQASGDKQMFSDAEQLQQAIEKKKIEVEIQISSISNRLSELDQFEKGKTFNADLIEIDYELDQDLVDHTALSRLEESLGIVQGLSFETIKWKREVEVMEKQLTQIRKGIPTFNEKILDEEISKYNNIIEVQRDARYNYGIQKAEGTERIVSLKEKLTLLKQIIDGKVKEKVTFEEQWRTYTADYDRLYPETSPDDYVSIETPLSELEQRDSKARENYVTEYKTIASASTNVLEVREQIEGGYYDFNVLEVALLGNKIKHTDAIAHILEESNRGRANLVATIHETMLRIFSATKKKYGDYGDIIKELNIFFRTRKISDKYTFRINMRPHSQFKIEWINQLQNSSRSVYRSGELPLGDSVETFVENFFREATGYNHRIALSQLLDPKTYFEVETKLTDFQGNDKPGSTGESYSAIVLLCIGRLSVIQQEKRKGIRFVILEETANLDRVNFNAFPDIAKEFGYQILTMTPRPYGSDSDDGWYLHHLLEGYDDLNINYPIPNSFFKTNEGKEDLMTYLAAVSK